MPWITPCYALGGSLGTTLQDRFQEGLNDLQEPQIFPVSVFVHSQMFKEQV